MRKKNNKVYENPCYGHLCKEYEYAEDLDRKINEIYQDWDSTEKRAFPFIKFLRRLGIVRSTLSHWKTCRPANLKLIEKIKLFCEETMFDSISDNKNHVLRYMEITKPKAEVKEEDKQGQEKVPVDFLTDEEDK